MLDAIAAIERDRDRESFERDESRGSRAVTAGGRAGPGLVPMWPTVPIDRPERSDYGVGIYSPSDQPVTVSAGVFSSVSAPSIRSQNAHGRSSEPTEHAREPDVAVAAVLRELGYGG